MRKWLFVPLLGLLAACGSVDKGEPTATPTPLDTATATVTQTVTVTHTSTVTLTATATATTPPTSTPSPTATFTATAVGAVAQFNRDPQSPANPFPSDRLIDENGKVHVTGELLASGVPAATKYNGLRGYLGSIAEQLSMLEGFSTFAPIRVVFDRAVTIEDVENPPGVRLYELGDSENPVPIRVRAVDPTIAGDFALEIQPLVPLRPKTTYFYAVTRDVVDATGNQIEPSPEFTAAIDGEIPSLQNWADDIDSEIDPGDVAIADVFTTQATTDDVIAIRDLFDNGTLPVATPVFENSPIAGLQTGVFLEGSDDFRRLTGAANSQFLAAVAVGSFPSYDFRFGAQSAFDPEKVAGRVTPSVTNLDFYVTIPKAPAPEGGYPVVIFGHGLGGQGSDAIGASRLFGDEPFMVIGITDVEHGRRGNVANFFNLGDVFATREHFRQTIVDFLQLQRMIRNATEGPFAQANTDDIRYMGVSLGGIMGSLYMGVESDVTVGMLSVPGGGLPNILQSQTIGALILPILSLVTQVPQADPFFPILLHRFTQTSQWSIDPGDPINTAPYMIDPDNRLPRVPVKRILMHEGIVDSIIPNKTTDDLARAMSLPDANASNGCDNAEGCRGIWRFVMTDYGFPQDSGHGVSFTVPQAIEQVKQFVASNGTLIIPVTPPAP